MDERPRFFPSLSGAAGVALLATRPGGGPVTSVGPAVGFVAFVGYGLFRSPPLAEALLVLAALVHVPLVLRVVDAPRRDGRRALTYESAVALWPLAALLLFVAIQLPPSGAAFVLGVPWLLLTVLMAFYGIERFLSRGVHPLSETAIDAGLGFSAVGGVWTIAYLGGHTLLGFFDLWVLLTAVHFHFAGLSLVTILGVAGRVRSTKLHTVSTWTILLSIPATAAGIALSPLLETLAGVCLAVGCLGLTIHLFVLGRRHHPLLYFSGLSLAAAMLLAAGFALSGTVSLRWLSIHEMIEWHGITNAVGFALSALLVFARTRPAARGPELGPPFSRLRSRGVVGPRFLERQRLLVDRTPRPRGLLDRLDELAHDGLDAAEVAPEIRAFYERTEEFDLRVIPDWQFGFRTGGKIWHWLSGWVGQTHLPVNQGSTSQEIGPLRRLRRQNPIVSRIVAIDDTEDGRERVRGWVRTYADKGKAMYIAAYATHRHRRVPYMNIAFPMPLGNLASILRMDPLGREGGVILRTWDPTPGAGDAGIWFSTPWIAFKLPLRESIEVLTPAMRDVPSDLRDVPSGTSLVARHDLWLFGIKYLTLDYIIFRLDANPMTA
ncbi:MAG: YndJ family transporter [Myxococcota bacterium]